MGRTRIYVELVISCSVFSLLLPLSLYFSREEIKMIGLERFKISNEIFYFILFFNDNTKL